MNKYDAVALDVTKLLSEQKHSRWNPQATSGTNLMPLSRLEALLNLWLTAGLYKTGLLRRLIYANLKLDWFYEFRHYWIKELGLRRLELHDFYFLLGIYRQKFQNLAIDGDDSPERFLQTWQHPATLYLLFHYQYKLALHPLSAYTLAKYIPRGGSICEYGCGLAPITHCLAKYYPHKNLRLTAADIPSYMLHFVRWKFRRSPFIRVISLDPRDNTPLDSTYDVITCMTVLEHVPRPLLLIKHLHQRLNNNGILMFDYIKSEGTGLDTKASLSERQDVLDFIQKNFTILRGSIPKGGRSVAAVICKKKRSTS